MNGLPTLLPPKLPIKLERLNNVRPEDRPDGSHSLSPPIGLTTDLTNSKRDRHIAEYSVVLPEHKTKRTKLDDKTQTIHKQDPFVRDSDGIPTSYSVNRFYTLSEDRSDGKQSTLLYALKKANMLQPSKLSGLSQRKETSRSLSSHNKVYETQPVSKKTLVDSAYGRGAISKTRYTVRPRRDLDVMDSRRPSDVVPKNVSHDGWDKGGALGQQARPNLQVNNLIRPEHVARLPQLDLQQKQIVEQSVSQYWEIIHANSDNQNNPKFIQAYQGLREMSVYLMQTLKAYNAKKRQQKALY